MGRLKNIAKSWQRLALPSGGWGVLLLTAFLLLAGLRYASAQNNSAAPYIGSTHLYRVAMGSTTNAVEWQLFDDITDANNNTNADYSSTASQAWATPAKVGTNAEITIKFVSTVFTNTTTTWYLVYNEEDPSHNCVARRSFEIKPAANEFYLDISQISSGCNDDLSGFVWQNGYDLNTVEAITSMPFTVEMHKSASHAVKEWRFNCAVSFNAASGYIVPALDADFILAADLTGSSTYGTFAISNVNATARTFTVVVTPNLSNAAYTTTDAVTFSVQIRGKPINNVDVTLTISSGQGTSGQNYDVVTENNGLYPSARTRTIYGIPNTSALVAN